MGLDTNIIPLMMDSILERTRAVLASETGLTVTGIERIDGDADRLELHDITAIVGLGGPLSLLVAFSFENPLLDAMFRRFTADIEVPEDEIDLYMRETAAEIVNTILGLCTTDAHQDQIIRLSPPLIVDDARGISRPKNAVFASMCIHTAQGCVDVSIITPRELIDRDLDPMLCKSP